MKSPDRGSKLSRWQRPSAVLLQRLTSQARLRDLCGTTYIQASQKNYGLASKTSASFFGLVQEVASQTVDANARKPYEELLAMREKIAAELAKGDAEVMNDLHPLYLKTQQSK